MRTIFFLLFLLLSGSKLFATHIRAGEITVERLDCASLEVRITLTAYIDSNSSVPFGSDGSFELGDGSTHELENVTAVPMEGYTDVSKVVYTFIHRYSTSGEYTITYIEPNRNPGVVNMSNSAGTPFAIQTGFTLDTGIDCNNTVVLTVPPVDLGCTNQTYFHIPGAVDPDGDSLVYRLVTPRAGIDRDVSNYSDLLAWANPTEDGETPVFEINPASGLITWDTPSTAGEFTITILIEEYRQSGNQQKLVGFTVRDMQIIVFDCVNKRPGIYPPVDTCIVAGSTFDKSVFASDPDNDSLKLEIFGALAGKVSVPDLDLKKKSPAEWTVSWITDCSDIQKKPYELILKVTDYSEEVSLSSFLVWRIKVIPPPPALEDITLTENGIVLSWADYLECTGPEVVGFGIYRKVAGNAYEPAVCETGVRADHGYEYVGNSPTTDNSYTDTDLVPAARICYRIVAYLSDGLVSVVSREICYDFIPSDRPVITHVSVDKTDIINGEIIVGWREPYDLEELQLPVNYFIERRSAWNENYQTIGQITHQQRTLDSLGYRDTGINTTDSIYYYRIRVIQEDLNVVSEEASSVRLDLFPGLDRIRMTWNSETPWSTLISGQLHEVYRAEPDAQLIGFVNPINSGKVYLDTLVHTENQVCYRILSKGTYGNPLIKSPLLNFSQVACTRLVDNVAPVAPVISIDSRDCSGTESVEALWNQIEWAENGDNDIAEYQVFFTDELNGEYTMIGTTSMLYYRHQGKSSHWSYPSLKGCYQVRAIDYFGNASALSNKICVDNCPNFLLPNIITPNGDECNEVFNAFSVESPSCNSGSLSSPRFVKEVHFQVFNRWGVRVYGSKWSVGEERVHPIYWEGKDDQGSPVPSGTYFYEAQVEFDVLEPDSKNKLFKGWVHVLR